MQARTRLLTLLAALTLGTLAQAGEILVRNKTLHEPDVLWVAEYQVGLKQATRTKGPWQIVPEDQHKWTKSAFQVGYERWIRWSPKKGNLKSSFTKSEWNSTTAKTGKKSIGTFVGTLNISDDQNKGQYQAKTNTGLWIGLAWAATWDAIWGPLSTAGDPLTVYNKTGVPQAFVEYERDILGGAVRIQGSDDGFTLQPGQSKTITKAQLDPGYTSRFLFFKPDGSWFPKAKGSSYWSDFSKQTKNCGKLTNKIYLSVDKNGNLKAYNDLEWQFKQTGCQLLVGAIHTAGQAANVVPLPTGILNAVGVQGMIQPILDELASVSPLDLPAVQDAITTEVDALIGDGNLSKIVNKVSKLANKASEVQDLMLGGCFCDDDNLDDIESELADLGLALSGLNLGTSGTFFQSFSMTTTFSYQQYNVSFTQFFATDWKGSHGAFYTFGLSAGTDIAKTPKVSQSLGMEVFPDLSLKGFNGLAWDIGVSGGGDSFPLSGGASAFFGVDATASPLPDLTQLVGIGFAVEPNDDAPDADPGDLFQASGGLSVTWPAY